MQFSNEAYLTKHGILEILDDSSKLSQIVVQVIEVEQKAFGLAYRCEIHDKRNKMKVLMKNANPSQQKVLNFDVIEIRKEDVSRQSSGENSFLTISKFKVLRNEQKMLGNKKPLALSVSLNKIDGIDRSPRAPSRNMQSRQSKLLSIREIKSVGQAAVQNLKSWRLRGKITNKSEVKQGRVQWFDCMLEDNEGEKIALLFFNNTQQFHERIENNRFYEVEEMQLFRDKRQQDKLKIKILSETTFTQIEPEQSIRPPIPSTKITKAAKYVQDKFDRDLSVTPPIGRYFNKIVYCLYVQGLKTSNRSEKRPQVIHISDQNNNIRKVTVWNDHNVSIPQTNQTILILNMSKRDDHQSDTFHTTKMTQILTLQQVRQMWGLKLKPIVLDEYLFYRRPHPESMKLSYLSQIFEKEGYYYVSVTLLFDPKEIKFLKKCKSCAHILLAGGGCACNKPILENYYNVKCKINDQSGSVTMSLYSTLVELMAGIDKREVDEEKVEGEIVSKLMGLNFKRELLKIQVRERGGRIYINGLDIFVRNIPSEIRVMMQKSSALSHDQ